MLVRRCEARVQDAERGAAAPVQARAHRAEEAAVHPATLLQGAVGPNRSAHRAANLSPSLATHCPPFSETGRCLSRAGCLTTAGVLCVGFGAFINGNKRLAQSMMRARVAAQFATIVAMGVATKYYSDVEAAKEPTKPKAATPGPAVV